MSVLSILSTIAGMVFLVLGLTALKEKNLGFFALLSAIGVILLVVAVGVPKQHIVANQDPRVGWVSVKHSDGDISKICDGATLLYTNHTKTDNSPQCSPSK